MWASVGRELQAHFHIGLRYGPGEPKDDVQDLWKTLEYEALYYFPILIYDNFVHTIGRHAEAYRPIASQQRGSARLSERWTQIGT